MRYIVYCRKSSESEDRQVLSILSQKEELKRAFFDRPEVTITDVVDESRTAKTPGRPVFNELLTRIEKGEADGIIAWHPDRLARNSIDGGRIIYLLDRGLLKDLRFATYTFENNSQGKFMLSIMFGYSKYYVDNLSENVKRGNRTKAQKGWWPGRASLGYLNDPETKTITRDPVRFPLIRRIFELMLTGTYSAQQIARIARDDWGFRTPKSKRKGGKPLALSSIYRILTCPLYAGLFKWEGQIFQGKHEAVVTLEEFNRVQELLGRPGRPRPKKHSFAFTGMIKCGRCGRMVTAESKPNRHGVVYTYYHCTKRLIPRCPEKYIQKKDLEEQISRFLSTLMLPDRLHTIAAQEAERQAQVPLEEYRAAIASLEQALDATRKEIAELTSMRVRGLISDDEFLTLRRKLQTGEINLRQKADKARENVGRFEPLRHFISFSTRAADWFAQGEDNIKRLVIETTGSDPRLIAKELRIEARKPFRRVSNISNFPLLCGMIEDVRQELSADTPEMAKVRHNLKLLFEWDQEGRVSLPPDQHSTLMGGVAPTEDKDEPGTET